MPVSRPTSSVFARAALAASLLAAPAHAAPRIENLGHLPAGAAEQTTQAQDISDNGEVVVGFSLTVEDVSQIQATARQSAFRWVRRQGMRALPHLPGGGRAATALAVSDNGRIVVGASDGLAAGEPFLMHATRWNDGMTPRDLGTLPGANESAATSLSGDGEHIAGYSRNRQGQLRAVRWHRDGPPQELGTLGGEESFATDMSQDGGYVVGGAHNAAHRSRAFVWSAARGMVDLGSLPGSADAQATAVSANGDVVVGCSADQIEDWSDPNADVLKGFIWHRANGRMQEIVNTLGGTTTLPLGVANGGTSVIGIAQDAHGVTHAFRWTPELGMLVEQVLPANLRMGYAKGLSSDGRFSAGRLQQGDTAFRAVWR
ncbi:MAG: hypothetical protein JO171_06265 [Paludibacterium sp.]|uniref:hypothetical protein n=1 Tax=Paludibacterium sp. TaxID=1917523 RepID=UPI0025E3AF7B|nr:hypothetical protein [Paludibacterium sp.]MBV8046735.1 hypothetical protein [Paludibacterium sp.]MBV8647434.1 hypothetical protein [Paludibacterium sp.]